MEWVVVILAGVMLVVFVYVSLAFRCKRGKKYQGVYRSPVVALELVESAEDVVEIVGGMDDKRRDKARTSVRRDYYLISSYLLLFLAMSVVPWRLEFPWSAVLAGAVVLVALATAIFDLLENRSITALLDQDPPSQSSINAVRRRGIAKWAGYFLTVALLSAAFIVREDQVRIVGVVVLAVSLVGLVSLHRSARTFLELVMGLASLGLLIMAGLFVFRA